MDHVTAVECHSVLEDVQGRRRVSDLRGITEAVGGRVCDEVPRGGATGARPRGATRAPGPATARPRDRTDPRGAAAWARAARSRGPAVSSRGG